MAHIVVAPDSFKGSIDAPTAAAAIAQGWLTVRPEDEITILPQADGGEGTLDAIRGAKPGSARLRGPVSVTGPDGRNVEASWLELPDGTAVVELASAAGLPLMHSLDAVGASTLGLGELLNHVLDAEPQRLVIALGGSATTDGAAGAFAALGLDAPETENTGVDFTALRPPPPGGVELLTDVDAPLLGPRGAAAVFAPQKGADATQVQLLEERLARWVHTLECAGAPRVSSKPGAGAAGGAGYGFMALWGAVATPGAERIASITGLDTAVREADVLVTGEGRFDATSLTGKVVGHGLQLARGVAIPAVVIAGDLAADPATCADVSTAGNASRTHQTHSVDTYGISLTELAGSGDAALAEPHHWLVEAGTRAAQQFESTPA